MFNSLLTNIKSLITLIFISVISLSLNVQAMPFSLKPLTTVSEKVSAEDGLATITMIYQPDCSWCKKQGESLAKVFEQCQSSMKVALVGTKGNKRQLKKELKHYHQDMPAYIADRKFLRSIGGYQASPTTLVYDSQGQLLANKRGFISPDKLAQALAIVSQGECQI